ncbi:MAG: hypothetical protein GF331_11910 [Chitinivibrionales bacterium]|nr:hypothetical protein [Chitinivibrionales bacterium]
MPAIALHQLLKDTFALPQGERATLERWKIQLCLRGVHCLLLSVESKKKTPAVSVDGGRYDSIV